MEAINLFNLFLTPKLCVVAVLSLLLIAFVLLGLKDNRKKILKKRGYTFYPYFSKGDKNIFIKQGTIYDEVIFTNKKNKKLKDKPFDFIFWDTEKPQLFYIVEKIGGKQGLVDENLSTMIIPAIYDCVHIINEEENEIIARAIKDGKETNFDSDGKIIK